ncbi:RNA polymerase sigma factor [Altererythrobacter sp. Root672]|uniref:RNA polymerase sigma factor n=1 Tax=Altererythrobacter sp. Root672 TaxID=1736584 RepID=UPI0006FD93E8|nr:sigma-70 family RNA polymerase sigma factor [Altererythrobacter sp. Root672]KRA84109.1 hypothetical protein ASD76_08960 [Altererythrobacter sp. Root672]
MSVDHGPHALDEPDEFAVDFRRDDEIVPSPALEALYREQSPRLLRSLTRRTSNREEARDLVQEVFYRVARLGTGGLQLIDRPQAYLSRMAANLLRDRAKQAWRRNSDSHVAADEVTLVGVDQERLLETRDMLARVEAAVMKLRPKTREIFLAHRIEGLSYAEIALRTGLSVKGVEKQMSKAICAIDRLIARDRA